MRSSMWLIEKHFRFQVLIKEVVCNSYGIICRPIYIFKCVMKCPRTCFEKFIISRKICAVVPSCCKPISLCIAIIESISQHRSEVTVTMRPSSLKKYGSVIRNSDTPPHHKIIWHYATVVYALAHWIFIILKNGNFAC